MISDRLIRFVINPSLKPTATAIELPNNQIDELEKYRRNNNH
jgi:hypothetical protein